MRYKPKKSLGQNFLVDQNIQRKIIASCELEPQDTVLEIGAGRGELTRLIAERVNSVYALEIDSGLCEILQDELKNYPNVKIINRDILKFNIKGHFRKFTNKIKVMGNIPYYIATPIIAHLLKHRDKIDTIFITVQKEFAARITAEAGSKEYGSLSCFVQYFAQAQKLFLIKKTCFSPKPKVDSCFLRLGIRKERALKLKDEQMFFKIIRAAFNKRRKTLRNSLEDIVTQEKLNMFFKEYGIDYNIRPEKLTLKNFANLAQICP